MTTTAFAVFSPLAAAPTLSPMFVSFISQLRDLYTGLEHLVSPLRTNRFIILAGEARIKGVRCYVSI